MRNIFHSLTLIALIACPLVHVFAAGEVAIYTGEVGWISKEAADEQAQICMDKLNDAGIPNRLFDSTDDRDALANWMKNTTGDGGLDVCILYGGFPSSIYPTGNALPDGSIAEAFIETTDGDAFINHADYMFYGSGRNGEDGLQNMMDIAGITMWDDNTPMMVTDAGKSIAPSLTDFVSDRPFHVNELAGNWAVEGVLAQNHDGTRADPIIVRDGNRGRLIPIMQTFRDDNPNGAVAAEVISYLMSDPKIPIATTTPILALSVPPAQTHIHVDAVNGINAPTGRGAAGKAYKSITYALLISDKNNLPEPWHVHIHPGTYNADPAKPANEREVFPIRLRSKMLFQGTTTATDCIIDAQHLGETQTEILSGIDVGEVSVRNLTVQNMHRTNGAGGIVFWDTGGPREAASSIEGCVVHNNGTDGVGTNLSLVLIGNTFSNNRDNGVWTNTDLTVLNNTFSHNRSTGLKFDQPYDHSHIYQSDISDNTFENNGSKGRRGVRPGGFLVIGNFTGDITRNKFIGNSGEGAGGFQVAGTLNSNISHNTFTGNQGTWSGAVWVEKLIGDVTHNTFTDNVGGFRSGGLSVQSTITGNITHNTFTRNTGGGSGGGFEVFNHTFTGSITHNLFDSNSNSGDSGGAISLPGDGNAEFTNNIFINNTAGNGGASVKTQIPSRFTNNLFIVSDGLSAAASIPAVIVENPGSRFHNNIFSGMKTAIYIKESWDLPITHNLFHNIGMDFVSQGGAGVGNDLAFWELLADGANNNIAGGLLLVDPANGNFHPVAGSPTIDAGTSQYAPADDLDGVARPVGNAVDIGPYEYKGSTGEATFAPEDVNQDGRVSIADVIEVAQSLGKPVSQKPRADVNGDGAISFADLVAIARAIAKARSAPPLHQAVVLDAATVQTWLHLARVEDDGSLMFREGIANLEQLLASLLPKETVLLANYPNPFNPETWIPYQLSKPAEVSIAIHAANGQLVRVLALGTQSAGMYQHRSRAAYWNGKNEVGEPVASGVYFYTLTAGEFTSTRKMLIRK